MASPDVQLGVVLLPTSDSPVCSFLLHGLVSFDSEHSLIHFEDQHRATSSQSVVVDPMPVTKRTEGRSAAPASRSLVETFGHRSCRGQVTSGGRAGRGLLVLRDHLQA